MHTRTYSTLVKVHPVVHDVANFLRHQTMGPASISVIRTNIFFKKKTAVI